MSRALAQGQGKDDLNRRGNEYGTPSAQGRAADQKVMWQEYVTKFCDPIAGDQGCTVPGVMAGKHTDIPGILWNDKQTIDMSVPDNQILMQAVMRYFVSPQVADPVRAVESPQGQEEILKRRAQNARINTVFNAVGMMLGERAGGSGVNTQNIRIAAGLPPGEASTDASYREISEAMTKDRFHNPEYITQLIENPEQLMREQIGVNAQRMKTLNDLYKRLEELVYMEAASFASDLDNNRPDNAFTSVPLR
jgi:hypothetical protein